MPPLPNYKELNMVISSITSAWRTSPLTLSPTATLPDAIHHWHVVAWNGPRIPFYVPPRWHISPAKGNAPLLPVGGVNSWKLFLLCEDVTEFAAGEVAKHWLSGVAINVQRKLAGLHTSGAVSNHLTCLSQEGFLTGQRDIEDCSSNATELLCPVYVDAFKTASRAVRNCSYP